jgi:hypothetical protein
MYINPKSILESQIVQRDFDKRWERIVKVMDHENAYSYSNENGVPVTLIPTKWLTVAVYDFLMEAV